MRKHQVDSEFVANNSDCGSAVMEERSESLVEYSFFPSAMSESSGSFNCIWNGTNPNSPIYIPSIFPANHSDSESNSIPGTNETYPKFSHNSNSIMSFFPPARSPKDSTENYEIIITNPSISATSFSISAIFPPIMSETETDGSCSESDQSPRAQFSNSIVSLFPPALSQTDSSSSENYEIIIPTDPSISARPNRRVQIETFKDLIEFLKPKSTTHNFSEDHKIGTGSFSSVYRATLDDGQVVAIKRAQLSMSTPYVTKLKDNKNATKNEYEDLSRLNHKNLVRLLGFCKVRNVRVVVYEYMENDTLHDHLHKLQSTPLISWAARIKVALDAAKGIEYLHAYAIPPIVHCDIKSSNILLDATWTAKVSDFGPSFMSYLSILGAGSVDPEYYKLQLLTPKSDVYSFGVVLLDILFGYKALHRDENGEPQSIVDFVVPYIAQDEIHKILDPKIPPPTPFELAEVAYVGNLALHCVSLEGRNRPQ
uniref:Protein kinase domain-containing protein n=1 Tax=Quercus lobata TaxID=97700 RepID=A0A7N2LL05_QUELO